MKYTVVRGPCAALLVAILWLAGCKPGSTKPDFVMEMNGFCPDDQTRTRIQSKIAGGISKLKDADLKQFLVTATAQDNIANALGQCPNGACVCPNNNYVLGVWRNDLVPAADRATALNQTQNFVPDKQTFAVRVEGGFLRDAVAFKWALIPKRFSATSRKPAADGAIELQDYTIDYPDTNEMRLRVTGQYHKYTDPSFSLEATDKVSLAAAQVPGVGLVHSVACMTARDAHADTSVIEGLSWFLVPFALERAANGGGQIEDILGITKGLDEAREAVPMGAGCAAVSILPSETPLPKLSASAPTALKVDFDYAEPSLNEDALLASGNLLFANREPSVTIGFPNGESGISVSPSGWYDVFVRSDQYGAHVAKTTLRALAKDMRDPTFSWSVLPTTWPGPSQTLGGVDVALALPIGRDAMPGDVGYAAVWVTATDADGFVAKANVAVRVRIATCCDTDMFNAYFTQFCAKRVGVNRERCGNTPSFPTPP